VSATDGFAVSAKKGAKEPLAAVSR
jgi:hypothetical protein